MYGIPGTSVNGNGYQEFGDQKVGPVSSSSTASSIAFNPLDPFSYINQVNGWNQDTYEKKMQGLANAGNVDAQQWLANKYATEKSEQTAREWTAQREDNAYQRLVADLEKAGISPYILSGATPAVSNSTGHSYSGTEMVSRANNKDTTDTSEKNAQMQSILRMIGIVAGALIYALI